MFPLGIGLFFVLSMSESISRSYHMFIAPEAPAPIEIQRIDKKVKNGCRVPGANAIPHIEVKMARDITLGFRRDM